MGKAVFLNVSGGGHVIATYGMAGELVQRGEQVIYWEIPRFQAGITGLGAEFRPYPPIRPYPGPLAKYPYHHELDLAPVMTWCALEWIPQLLEPIRAEKPDYIVYDSLCIWGRIIAHLLEVPAFTSIHTPALSLPMVLRAPQVWAQFPRMYLKSFASLKFFRQLEKQLRATYGVATSYMDTFTNRQPVNFCHAPRELQPSAHLFGDDYHFIGSVHTRPASGNALLDRLADELIYIGFGTICDPGPQFFRNCIQALGDLDLQVVMVLSNSTVPEDLGTIPPNFVVWSLRRDGLVPQLDILPRAKVFIMNGGNGGARESGWFSVPMIAVPPTFETDLIAQRIAAIGAGIHLRPAKATPKRLRAAVDLLLKDPSYRQASGRLGDACRAAGGGARAAEIILKAVGQVPAKSSTSAPAAPAVGPNGRG